MVTAEQIDIGAKVLSADGKQLGHVREVAHDSFQVARRFLPAYWVANEYVDNVSGGIVQMLVTRDGLKAARLS